MHEASASYLLENEMSYLLIKNAGPIPPMVRDRNKSKNYVPRWPFHLLEVGDAFDLEGEGEPDSLGYYKNWKSAVATGSRQRKIAGKTFTSRRVSEKVLRFYRVA